jgi:5-(carboxyamino)imidazole ribonucleotide mutase
MKRVIPIIMGSKKDYHFAERIGKKLEEFELPFDYRAASAHKNPEDVLEMVEWYDENYEEVIYETVAGRSNALSGVVAGRTIHPVIACPPDEDRTAFYMDIWSSLRTPGDIPVMTVPGPENAALAAARICALYDPELAERLEDYHSDIVKKLRKTDMEFREGMKLKP